MKRRSFLSLVGLTPLLRMPLWGQESTNSYVRAWGPPFLKSARGEYKRIVISFTPVNRATSYRVRYDTESGKSATIDGVLVTDYTIHGLENGTRYQVSVAAEGSPGTTSFSNELAATPTAEMDWRSLAEAFSGANPMRSSCPFWMVHGNESNEDLRWFLEVIYRFGFEGVTLHPYDYHDFLGEGMWSRWRVILEHARKLGLVVWQQDDKDYPSGYAGGKIVAENQALAKYEVTLSFRETYHGPRQVSLNLPGVLPAKHRLVAVSAFGPSDGVVDLTDRVVKEELKWDVPEGDWEVFVMTTWQPGVDDPRPRHPDVVRGEVRGYIDPLSPIATDRYLDAIYRATERALAGPDFERVWRGWFIDEPAFYSSGAALGELGKGYPYTPDLFERFEQRYDYSLRPYLPLLWISRHPKATKVRYDYMDLVSSEYDRLFIGKIREFCESRGKQMVGHVIELAPFQLGYGTGGNFRALENFSMGGFDHIFDQWYLPDEDVYWRQCKMASSISHYKQTPLDEALVEHFAATGWRTGVTEMKAMMDWTTSRGVSRIVPCGLDTQDPPDWEDTPEFWLHGMNPLAPYFHAYQVIANRETMMIHGGRHVAKALLLDTAESAWVGSAEELWKVDKAFSQAHIDYDNVSYHVFTDPTGCRIQNKQILLGREEYEFVVLPQAQAVPIAVLRRLVEFYEAGGTVILLGPEQRLETNPGLSRVTYTTMAPWRDAGGMNDQEAKDLAARLWGDRASHRGRAFYRTYKDIQHLLYQLDAHDVWIEPTLEMLQYYHRRLSGRDLYFFNNEGEPVHTTVRLRGVSGVPELWDPVTGRIIQAACYAAQRDETRLRLDLERYESVFIVVNPSVTLPETHVAATDAANVIRRDDGQIVLKKYASGPIQYTLVRPDGRSEQKRVLTAAEELSTLTLGEGWSREPTQPNGAIYRVRFNWPYPAGIECELRIEDMTEVVRVSLNGKDLGIRFTYPFRFELEAALRRGQNELEIEHTERYLHTSKLGTVTLVPYYAFRV